MKVTILIDNIKDFDLKPEWGFCTYIENENKKYLLDTGGSNKYLYNANKLGIDISEVDAAILSHAHIDHSGGYRSFFEINKEAKLYISGNAKENCFFKLGFIKKYVGLPKGLLDEYKDRIVFVNRIFELDKNVYIMEHTNRKRIKSILKVKENKKYIDEDFSHEQNLIFDTQKGLVVLNSCSHIGPDEIIKEVNEQFVDKKIYMLIGGLHLAGKSSKYVKSLAKRIEKLDIDYIYTGHCTKNKAYNILHKELGNKVVQVKCGMEIEI